MQTPLVSENPVKFSVFFNLPALQQVVVECVLFQGIGHFRTESCLDSRVFVPLFTGYLTASTTSTSSGINQHSIRHSCCPPCALISKGPRPVLHKPNDTVQVFYKKGIKPILSRIPLNTTCVQPAKF
ncbi:hypothetical protein C1O63_0766 [Dehalococcoides mccartyi]|nr:hypothetical protein C1O63_0766 [Dehalococcoides mccartyi]